MMQNKERDYENIQIYRYRCPYSRRFGSQLGGGDLDLTLPIQIQRLHWVLANEWNGYSAAPTAHCCYVGNLSTSAGGAGTFSRCHWNLPGNHGR